MRLRALTTVLAVALVLAGAADADPLRYGVADDYPLFHRCGDDWWSAAHDIGYQELRMTVQWDAAAPAVIPNEPNLQDAVTCAALNGIDPVLAVYPLRPASIGGDDAAQRAFASFVALVGQDFPTVRSFVVGNEPNVNRFWQPQFVNGRDAAARDYEHTLAYTYDALKTVRPDASVWGPAISSRGNDDAYAVSNPSHSPVQFIAGLAAAYRASGRTAPIFDEFDMHPYPPVQDTDPFSRPFRWPKAGAANLDRIKQALWDGFDGTGQPVPAAQPLSLRDGDAGLPIDLDEAGEQTAVTGHDAAYSAPPENVRAIPEAEQARNHVELAELAACDPDVRSVFYFPLVDDVALSTGFQSGNLFADLTPKASYAALKRKIADAKGICQGGVYGVRRAWSPATGVVGARMPRTLPAALPFGTKRVAFTVTAAEDVVYRAQLVRYRLRSAAAATAVGRAVAGSVRAYRGPVIAFPAAALVPGAPYGIVVTLSARLAPARTTTLASGRFTLAGAPVSTSGSLGGLFRANRPVVAVRPTAASIDALAAGIAGQLGVARRPIAGSVSLGWASSREPRPSRSLPAVGFAVRAGARPRLPRIGRPPAGRYRVSVAFRAGGRSVRLWTPPLLVDGGGHVRLPPSRKG